MSKEERKEELGERKGERNGDDRKKERVRETERKYIDSREKERDRDSDNQKGIINHGNRAQLLILFLLPRRVSVRFRKHLTQRKHSKVQVKLGIKNDKSGFYCYVPTSSFVHDISCSVWVGLVPCSVEKGRGPKSPKPYTVPHIHKSVISTTHIFKTMGRLHTPECNRGLWYGFILSVEWQCGTASRLLSTPHYHLFPPKEPL